LRAALRQDDSLVNQLLGNREFLRALLNPRDNGAFRTLLDAHLGSDDGELNLSLMDVNEDCEGASAARESVARLRNWLADEWGAGKDSINWPKLVQMIVKNPAFIERLKIHKSLLYRHLLSRAEAVFRTEPNLSRDIGKELRRLACFDAEGGLISGEQKEITWKAKKLLEAIEAGRPSAVAEMLGDGDVSAFINEPDVDRGFNALCAAVVKGDLEIVELLLGARADPNQSGGIGWPPLHDAAYRGHSDIVRALLQAGAAPNQTTADGVMPLHAAAIGGHEAIVRQLLTTGVPPDCPTTYGWTPLHQASYWGYARIVELLVQAGADPNRADGAGLTALHRAVSWGNEPIIGLLIQTGADPNRKDANGRSALDYAHEAEIPRPLMERLENVAGAGGNLNTELWSKRQGSPTAKNFQHRC
jgi:hypothetical protein